MLDLLAMASFRGQPTDLQLDIAQAQRENAMLSVGADVAEGYAPVLDSGGQLIGWRKNIYSFPPIGSPDGGAYTTVGDLARFIDAVKSCSPLNSQTPS